MKHLMKCSKCEIFTMKETCSKCSLKTESVVPAKFSPEDKMGKYRRMAKKEGI